MSAESASEPLRITISVHRQPGQPTHLDAFLESSGSPVVLTYQILRTDFINPGIWTRQSDHRRIYLDYSGPVSHNRGRVRIWRKGLYRGDTGSPFLKITCRGAAQAHSPDCDIETAAAEPPDASSGL